MSTAQLGLWDLPPTLPEGFAYRADLLSPGEEYALLGRLRELGFREFEFHGHRGRRRVVSFGFRYDFEQRSVCAAEPIPGFLLPLRDGAASFIGIAAAELGHVLVAEYAPGAGIGWHRDRPHFGEIAGVSLGSPCRFRMRQKTASGWSRAALTVEPRSIYLLRGPARWEWEHRIPPGERLRYSVTFRTVRAKLAAAEQEDKR